MSLLLKSYQIRI